MTQTYKGYEIWTQPRDDGGFYPYWRKLDTDCTCRTIEWESTADRAIAEAKSRVDKRIKLDFNQSPIVTHKPSKNRPNNNAVFTRRK
jgi:hypothetical protein